MIDNFNKHTLKSRKKSKWKNNGFRSIFESIIPNEVIITLRDWKDSYKKDNYVLIGAYALSYHTKPRYTEDVDLIFMSFDEIPQMVTNFRRNRNHSFEHIKTGVEVELLTPDHLNRDVDFFKAVFDSSIISDGIRIASPVSLIALKLRRFNNTDKSDITEMYKYCMENNIYIDLNPYKLSSEEIEKYENLIKDIDSIIHENMYMLENSLNISSKKHIKYKFSEYEIYIMNENFGEPRFHFTKNIQNDIKRFEDFQFAISITKPFDDLGNIRVLNSSTEYNSLSNFKGLESELRVWMVENLEVIREDWNKLNYRKIYSK